MTRFRRRLDVGIRSFDKTERQQTGRQTDRKTERIKPRRMKKTVRWRQTEGSKQEKRSQEEWTKGS